MDIREYCFICKKCGSDLSFEVDDEGGYVRVEPLECCLTKDVCIYTDCKYKDTSGCRVYGLDVKGITECGKYKVHVPLTSRRKIPG